MADRTHLLSTILGALFLPSAVLIVSAEQSDPVSSPPPRMVATKLIRPGVNGVAGIPAAGSCLISEGVSRERAASGAVSGGVTGFYECSLTSRFAVVAIPVHWTANSMAGGRGDAGFGAKYVFSREGSRHPTLALGYVAKAPIAAGNFGSGYADHKLTTYLEKTIAATRLTGNYVVKLEGHSNHHLWQRTWSFGASRPIHRRFGVATQAYYTGSSVAQFGGILGAATYHIRPACAVHLGVERGLSSGGMRTGVVWGVTALVPLRRSDN